MTVERAVCCSSRPYPNLFILPLNSFLEVRYFSDETILLQTHLADILDGRGGEQDQAGREGEERERERERERFNSEEEEQIGSKQRAG